MDKANNITKEEFEENKRKMQEIFHQIEMETLEKMPLWMRLNYFCYKLSKAFKNGHKDEDVKWDYINEMCTKNLCAFDYNLYKPVYSFADFDEQRGRVICADAGITPWQKHKCKDCGQEFYMTHNEVMFFQEKELNLPKRCSGCRNKRKGATQRK